MDRNIDQVLRSWAKNPNRKPLLVRGARQTGKTFAVQKLGKIFSSFVEINFEREPRFCRLFDHDLDIGKILVQLSALKQVRIAEGETLLFLDEIQNCPRAILALRYFFEQMPGLHVIGAGSLLEFELRNVSVPVGRIAFLYIRPFTFDEYLRASGRSLLSDAIAESTIAEPLDNVLHEESLGAVKEYMYFGGMPGVIETYLKSKSIAEAETQQRDILQTYRADFSKYTGRTGIEYIEKAFGSIPSMVGEKTVFSRIDPDARAYQIKGALDLLSMARVIHKVYHTSGAGVPLGTGSSQKHYKTIFLDIGLMQRLLEVRYEDWWNTRTIVDGHRGSIAEQFIGQELLNRRGAFEDPGLFFWHRTARSSQAEVDYLCESDGKAVPIEVKSGAKGHLKSMHQYLSAFPNVPGGIKCSMEPLRKIGNIISVPPYMAGRIPEFALFR